MLNNERKREMIKNKKKKKKTVTEMSRKRYIKFNIINTGYN